MWLRRPGGVAGGRRRAFAEADAREQLGQVQARGQRVAGFGEARIGVDVTGRSLRVDDIVDRQTAVPAETAADPAMSRRGPAAGDQHLDQVAAADARLDLAIGVESRRVRLRRTRRSSARGGP